MPSKKLSYDPFYIDVNSEVYKKLDNINKRNKALEEKYIAEKRKLQRESVQVIRDVNKTSNIKFKKVTTKVTIDDWDDILKRSAELDKHIHDIDVEGDIIIKTFDKDRKLFTCHALFFRLIEKNETLSKEAMKRTIKHNGRKYRQVKTMYGNVKGDIMSFNNKYTFKEDVDIRTWKQLLHILATDKEMKESLGRMLMSLDIHCIYIKDTVSSQEGAVKPHKPLRRKLFSETAPKAIHRKDISYNLNKQAASFGDMFKIQMDEYTIDNYVANSCFLNLIVDTWHSAFEKRKPNGKRYYVELTYESVCNIIGLKYKNQDIGISIRESIKFFEKFRLGLDVVNVFGEILYFFRPENKKTKYKH